MSTEALTQTGSLTPFSHTVVLPSSFNDSPDIAPVLATMI